MVAREGFKTDVQIDLIMGSRGCPYNCKFCDFKFNPLGEKEDKDPPSVTSLDGIRLFGFFNVRGFTFDKEAKP